MLLLEGLVWARLVVEAREFGDEASQVCVTVDDNVGEKVASQRAGEAFSEGVHVRRVDRGATRVSTAAKARAKPAPNFESRSQNSTCGPVPSKVALRGCAPRRVFVAPLLARGGHRRSQFVRAARILCLIRQVADT